MIEPITSHVAGQGIELAANTAESQGPDAAQPEDVARFESALNQPPETTIISNNIPPAASGDASLGNAILDQIEATKAGLDAARNGINQRLAAAQDGNISVADIIQLQRDLTEFNLQATFASKVTEEVNQGIQTMMKSQ